MNKDQKVQTTAPPDGQRSADPGEATATSASIADTANNQASSRHPPADAAIPTIPPENAHSSDLTYNPAEKVALHPITTIDDDLLSLLADAKSVALFGQRTGRLKGNALPCAIAAAERKTQLTWLDDEAVKLQEALNLAVGNIAPVTLLHLRSGWNPFVSSRGKLIRRVLKCGTYILISAILMIAAAITTFILDKGASIIRPLESLATMDPSSRISHLQRQILRGINNDGRDAADNVVMNEAYFGSVDELRRIDQELMVYLPLSSAFLSTYTDYLFPLRNFFDRPDSGVVVASAAPSVWASPAAPGASATPAAPGASATSAASGAPTTSAAPSASASPSAPSVSATPAAPGATATPAAPGASATPATPGASATPAAPGASATSAASGAPTTSAAPSASASPSAPGALAAPVALGTSGVPGGVGAEVAGYGSQIFSCELTSTLRTDTKSESPTGDNLSIATLLLKNQRSLIDLYCLERLRYQPTMIPSIKSRVSDMKLTLGLYSLWVLPAICGILGATVFFMRSLLDPLIPDPPGGEIFLRVALGALAGIILGWFWSPDDASGTGVSNVGLGLFALSFLVGFSINVFFVMLDRFVMMTEEFVSNIGRAPPRDRQATK